MVEKLFLLEFDAYNETTTMVETQYFATGGGFISKKSETPSLQKFIPRITDLGGIDTFMFGNATTSGSTVAGFGKISLNNADGFLDFIMDYGVDGRDIIIREGSPDSDYPSGFTTKYTGKIVNLFFNDLTIDISVKNNKSAIFDLPYQPVKYDGDNDNVTIFLEGTDNDIGGSPKPRIKGIVKNISPPVVNSGREIYQLSSDEVDTIDNVYDGRSALSVGTQRATTTDLINNNPAPGDYDYYLGDNTEAIGDNERGAYIRVGSTPAFKLTVDVTEGSSAADRTIAQIVNNIIVENGFTIDSTSITDMDTAFSGEIGNYSGLSESNVGDIINPMLLSGYAYLIDDFITSNQFIIGQLDIPTVGEVKATLADNILLGSPKVRFIPSRDQDKGIPINKVNIGYKENYTIMSESDMTGGAVAVDGEVAFVSQRYRKINEEDATVKVKHLTSPEKNLDTKINGKIDAETIGQHILDLFKISRIFAEFQVPTEFFVDEATGVQLDLNDVVRVQGKIYRITGLNYKFPRESRGGSRNVSGSLTVQGWGGIDG